MPNQRLRRILKALEVPVESSSTSSTRIDTKDIPDNQDDLLPQKRSMWNHTTNSSSRILLQAMEYRTMKKRKYTQENIIATTVPMESNDSCNNKICSNNNNNNTALDSDIHARNERKSTKDIVESIHELRQVYLYGLQTVSKLQDLRDAPDAILPGNFCDTK